MVKEIFFIVLSIKEKLWGEEFWSDGYFVNTVGEHASNDFNRLYIKNHGRDGRYNSCIKKNAEYATHVGLAFRITHLLRQEFFTS